MGKVRVDDCFNNGIFEVARFDNIIVTQNNMTEEQHREWIAKMASHYDEKKKEIDNLVETIKNKLALVDPLMLFNFLTSMNSLSLMNLAVSSEMNMSAEITFQLRSVEYIQSLLVSMEHDKCKEIEKENQEAVCYEILNLCIKLYSLMLPFYSYWASWQEVNGNLNFEDEEYIIFAQLMSQVRGKQYQVFRIPVLKELLFPQKDLLNDIYGLSFSEIISGLETMEKNLSSGRLDEMKALSNQIDHLDLFDDMKVDSNALLECQEMLQKIVGTALFDIKKNTTWSDMFINDLSLNIGSDSSFLNHKEFPGWPIWNLPIQYKPFIKLNKSAYCFDYYNLFDNFYVALQRAVRSHGKEYSDKWNEVQGYSSERIVGSVFGSLLPGCSIHYSNYYPLEKNNSAENDLLIEYKDVLMIVEVKAGTFVYTPAMMDYQAHKNSFKALVEKAENQCIRVKNYIVNGGNSKIRFYTNDSMNVESFSLDGSKYSQIYMFDVTVSDFNEFAAHMEKVKIANAHEGIIALSINDLWVYKYYFNDPLQFIHFVRQRTIATETIEIAVSDELDHLGMYIHHNMYSLQAKDIGGGTNVNFMGYREDIDEYLSGLHLGIAREKPVQSIPKEISSILKLALYKNGNVTKFTNFLLDLSTDSRMEFAETISKLAGRERELGRMVPAICFGDVSYALFIEVPNIIFYPKEKRKEYVLANLVQSKREECWSITVVLNEQDDIRDFQYTLFCQTDIRENQKAELQTYGKEIVEQRKRQFLVQNNKKKIYPNDPCICGSGKKYKRCCGRR